MPYNLAFISMATSSRAPTPPFSREPAKFYIKIKISWNAGKRNDKMVREEKGGGEESNKRLSNKRHVTWIKIKDMISLNS